MGLARLHPFDGPGRPAAVMWKLHRVHAMRSYALRTVRLTLTLTAPLTTPSPGNR
jgi:hypothetical protein